MYLCTFRVMDINCYALSFFILSIFDIIIEFRLRHWLYVKIINKEVGYGLLIRNEGRVFNIRFRWFIIWFYRLSLLRISILYIIAMSTILHRVIVLYYLHRVFQVILIVQNWDGPVWTSEVIGCGIDKGKRKGGVYYLLDLFCQSIIIWWQPFFLSIWRFHELLSFCGPWVILIFHLIVDPIFNGLIKKKRLSFEEECWLISVLCIFRFSFKLLL